MKKIIIKLLKLLIIIGIFSLITFFIYTITKDDKVKLDYENLNELSQKIIFTDKESEEITTKLNDINNAIETKDSNSDIKNMITDLEKSLTEIKKANFEALNKRKNEFDQIDMSKLSEKEKVSLTNIEKEYNNLISKEKYKEASLKLEELITSTNQLIESKTPILVTDNIKILDDYYKYENGTTYFEISGKIKNNNSFDLKKIEIEYSIDNYFGSNRNFEDSLIIILENVKSGEVRDFKGKLSNLPYDQEKSYFTYNTIVRGYK